MSITIDNLTEASKGREVRYRTHGQTEFGSITSWNDRFVFVRYHTVISDEKTNAGSPKMWHRNGETSEATRPEDLEFV